MFKTIVNRPLIGAFHFRCQGLTVLNVAFTKSIDLLKACLREGSNHRSAAKVE